METSKTRFTTGRLLWTRGVNERVAEDIHFAKFVTESLRRHIAGDWGDLCEEDKQMNDDAIEGGDRIFSSYKINDDKIWIITEHNRSATTLLLPEEY